MAEGVDELLGRLERDGVLLVQDAALPSVATLVAGGPVRGSWWGHPSSPAIFAALEVLDDHPDLLFAKLVDGKNTIVHRRLWPALAAIGRWSSRSGRARVTGQALRARLRPARLAA